jgi:NTE family protein
VEKPLGGGAPKVGLVLAGGAARGAYEVGVLEHIVEHVSKELGYDVPLDILCGTSVGAINACTMAAYADEPRGRVARMASVWSALKIDQLLVARTGGTYGLFRALLGRRVPALEQGSVFEAEPLAHILGNAIPFERIDGHLRSGRISAVTVSATQIATGRAVVFIQRRRAREDLWDETHNIVPRPVRMRLVHALASAAVPLMFPAVKIDGRFYCDGGIRQNIPLSPARRLGAQAMVVINPRYRPKKVEANLELQREEAFPSALFLLGKTLNAMMLARIDNDLDRLHKINSLIDAGTRRWGPGFIHELNEELGHEPGNGLRRLDTVHIRASANIGAMCADYVRSKHFTAPGMLGRVMRQLAEGEATREADLLSYLLFDGRFARDLIDLGRQDGRAHHDQLCQLFEAVRAAGEA